MWTCPVCEQTCTNSICSECGFEYSANFEQFPTLQQIAVPSPAISSLREAYKAKNTVNTCPCCGGELANNHCTYCSFETAKYLSQEKIQKQAIGHALATVASLTDFAIVAYRYSWVPEHSRLEQTSKKIVRLGDAQDFFNTTVWSKDKFAQLRDGNGTEINLSITYKYKGKRKALHCSIPTVKCDDFWRVGISLDLSFHLKIYLGSSNKIIKSAPISLDLT